VKGLWTSTARWSVGSAFLVAALAGQALAAGGTIKGKITFPSGPVDGSIVSATNEKFQVYRADVGDDGTYTLENVEPGTYTVSAIVPGNSAPDITNASVKDGQTLSQDFTVKAAEPFCIVKSNAVISLDSDIDSPDFADAQQIDINSGRNVAVPTALDSPDQWGGPGNVSGRFKIKYSSQAIHIAGEVTFKTPRVNNQVDDNLWNGNALEIDIQNDPYDATRTGKDTAHDWQVAVGLGAASDWWEHNTVQARPQINGKEEAITNHIKRVQDPNDKSKEKVRIDIPWAILLQGDKTGQPISPPADDALGAFDIALDAADWTQADLSSAVRVFQLSWSGKSNGHWNASSMVPVKFCSKP